MPSPIASILLIGDELLQGDIIDRNGPFFAENLTAQGLRVRSIQTLPDDPDIIAEALQTAASCSQLVVLCGGLGPTSDDRTTEAVARVYNRNLILHEEQWERIRQLFLAYGGGEPTPGNEKQVLLPEGAEPLANAIGAALGYVIDDGPHAVAVFPGPPKENQLMFNNEMVPWLDRRMPQRSPLITKVFRVFGLTESEVGYRLKGIEADFMSLRLSYRFFSPEILVKLQCAPESLSLLESATSEVEALLSPHLYGDAAARLPEVLGRLLVEQGLRIVTAESCTGGLAAKLLTDISGSSSWMEEGFVTYTNAAKERILEVPGPLLEQYGAVSEPVAKAMLEGALKASTAQVGFAITGIAGPTGGTEEKPVGTVCIAYGDRAHQSVSTHHFHWDRENNRLVSAWAAIYLLYQHLLQK